MIGDVYMLCAQQVFASKDIAVMAVPYFQCLIKDTNEEMSVLGEACKEKVDNKDFQEAISMYVLGKYHMHWKIVLKNQKQLVLLFHQQS